MRNRNRIFWEITLALTVAGLAGAATCESLTALALPNTTVTSAQSTNSAGSAVGSQVLPAFCRVAATIRPTSDSDIRIEVWLPLEGWNGNLLANGNGGWSGSINPQALGAGLMRGYASAMSDLGHEGSSASFALGHPEKLVDYGYRAAHEMVVAAKAIIAGYYGHGPKFSYWSGCSAGGRSALMEAQRFPADFDGIIAGDPGLNWTGRAIQSVWVAQAAHKSDEAYIPPDKYPFIHEAVIQACDARDGVKDGVLEDPTRCNFDPVELQCKGSDNLKCLTAPQVETARAIYATVTNRRTKKSVAPAFERGSELGWATMAGPRPFGIGDNLFKYVVFQDPSWDYKTFNFDSDLERTAKAENGLLNAMDPNLSAFMDRGGKLIQYHGWSDPQIAPSSSVDYYTSVLETLGGAAKVQSSYRLFMVPGMAHCRGGEGTSSFDMLSVLQQWVENGKAPDRIEASRIRNGITDRTRPLCPYPQVAVYAGKGSTAQATNFSCGSP
jgi:feruloyl esterase